MDFHCMIEGNIVKRDPESFTTRQGIGGVRFEIVHKQSYRGADGKYHETKPQYYSVVCWGKLGERILNSLKKGDTVTVSASRMISVESNGFVESTLTASNVSASLRWAEVTPERKTRSATAAVTTADGETLPVYDDLAPAEKTAAVF